MANMESPSQLPLRKEQLLPRFGQPDALSISHHMLQRVDPTFHVICYLKGPWAAEGQAESHAAEGCCNAASSAELEHQRSAVMKLLCQYF